MPASSEHARSTRARSIFAELVRELESTEAPESPESPESPGAGTEIDLERACRAHPELERELRELNAHWMRLNVALDRLASDRVLTREISAPGLSPPEAETRRKLERLPSPDRARYEILEEIARGGMGVVLRVRDAALERELAMKLVRDPGSRARGGGWRRLSRFLAEARLAGKLDHPGIVPIHDLGVDSQGRAFFTMPLVRGQSLTEVIDLVQARREGWTQARVLETVLKVCDTVAYAHSIGIVHRDLKPDNVMIGRFGETYVMDWGLARVLGGGEESASGPASDGARSSDASTGSTSGSTSGAADDQRTRDGDVLGTPAYMAPEQAGAQLSQTSAQADVYSVGAILYHLLAGRAPYSTVRGEHSGRDVLDLVREGPPESLEVLAPEASPELVAICTKAMARSCGQRYPDMRAMSDDLRAYMDGRVVHAHEGGALAELRKWVARNRGLAIAIASALVLAIGGLAAVSFVETTSKNEILKLSDLRRIETLERQADALWPAVPEKVGALEAWLESAESLVQNRALHEHTLRDMRERMGSSPAPGSPAQPSANNAASNAGSNAGSNADQWRFENQTKLVAELERLADPDPRRGLIANVRERLSNARSARRRSLADHAAEWRAAIELIASVDECPLYRGLKIAPQLGLVPIRRDPRSHLWEFAHLASGAPAQPGPDGTLALTAETGIVLVLIPGGSATIGSRPPKPGQPADLATDPLARSEELPTRTIDLSPFFLSKYELSRAQWERWCASDPSAADSGATQRGAADPASQPARGISWLEADRVLGRMGLALPTEAQWEHAARAGTNTRWWCGNEPRLLVDAANVGSGIDGSLPYADAFVETAPIDALRPNPWGLYHVHGNVSEWTHDVYWPNHEVPLRQNDGLVLAAETGLRAARGGSYRSSAADARTASRIGVAPENHDAEIGVRAARPLDP